MKQKYFPQACGLTKDNRPNVVLQIDSLKSYYYCKTFKNPKVALEFLKEIYTTGIAEDDIENGIWLTIKELV